MSEKNQKVRDMAGQNVTVHLDSRFAEINIKIDAQMNEMRMTCWMMGTVLTLLAILTALGLLNTVLGLAKS